MHDTRCFHLEINSLADFAAFVAIIKGETADLEKLAAALVSFKASDDAVQQALDNSTKENPNG